MPPSSTTPTRGCSSAPATATPPYTPPRWPSSRRSNPSKPEQPRAAAKQVGVPFLWEDLPGIPKKQTLHKRSTNSALPPPPARPAKPAADRRPHYGSGVRRDPFLTALLECSKIDTAGDPARHGGARLWKSLVYEMSCKRACGVSDSLVLLPVSARRRPFRYDLFNNAPSG